MTKKRIAAFAGLAVLPIVLALWLAGFDVSYQLGNYVISDNGVVQGEVYHASAPAAAHVDERALAGARHGRAHERRSWAGGHGRAVDRDGRRPQQPLDRRERRRDL